MRWSGKDKYTLNERAEQSTRCSTCRGSRQKLLGESRKQSHDQEEHFTSCVSHVRKASFPQHSRGKVAFSMYRLSLDDEDLGMKTLHLLLNSLNILAQLYGCWPSNLTEDAASFFFASQHHRPKSSASSLTKFSSRRRQQECSGARSRASTESSIARQHCRGCSCCQDSTKYSASCAITCDNETSASTLTDAISDRASLNLNEHDGKEGEDDDLVGAAHRDSGHVCQQ